MTDPALAADGIRQAPESVGHRDPKSEGLTPLGRVLHPGGGAASRQLRCRDVRAHQIALPIMANDPHVV